MKYRKKPIIVEVFKYKGEWKSNYEQLTIPEWVLEAFKIGTLYYVYDDFCGEPELYLITLEGTHRIRNGDYIVKGVNGELYNCRADIFESTYEEVLVQN